MTAYSQIRHNSSHKIIENLLKKKKVIENENGYIQKTKHNENCYEIKQSSLNILEE